MNWGKGILIAMIAFMGFIIYLGVTLMSQKVDLESDDYYKREMAYQDEIVALNNASALDNRIKVSGDHENILIQLPDSVEMKNVNVFLRRPDDQKLDLNYVIENTLNFTIDKSELKKGVYQIELSYQVDGKDCLQKERIYL